MPKTAENFEEYVQLNMEHLRYVRGSTEGWKPILALLLVSNFRRPPPEESEEEESEEEDFEA